MTSDISRSEDAPASSAGGTGPAVSRVGQACMACRRKKVKCDGKQPCHNCSSRDQVCEFPGSKDNAFPSRNYASAFEARCQQMDIINQKLEDLANQLSRSIHNLNFAPRHCALGALNEDLIQAASVLQSMPALQATAHTARSNETQGRENAPIPQGSDSDTMRPGSKEGPELPFFGSEDEGSDSEIDQQVVNFDPAVDAESNQAGALVRDSYGRLRFVGGGTNNILIEAVKNLSPAGQTMTSIDLSQGQSTPTPSDLEIPLFVRGRVWPDLPFLPKPDQLLLPPQYIADLLIGVYFDQLHYTFPIIYKPSFMKSYRQRLRGGQVGSDSEDRRFLLVFFAVCACASSILPSDSEDNFPGLKYYQKALLMYYASNGEASLERVQCLALLAVCAAGWNTLTQSWILVGQAVRAAMDIGLHLSDRLMILHSQTSRVDNILRQQISRRVWWSLYSLDRVISICLGRPMAAHDDDCFCELPLNFSDEELNSYAGGPGVLHRPPDTEKSPPTTGFLALARLCRIAGYIQQLNSPRGIRNLSSGDPAKTQKFISRVLSLDRGLRTWLETLPDDIRFSASSLDRGREGDRDLTMSVVIFIFHAGSLLNLYRCFLGHHRSTALLAEAFDNVDAISQCVSAARSCINASELLQDLVPPSHHLAMCLHYLTLSGIVLLRIPATQPENEMIAEVEKCIGFLRNMELRWSGAARSRAIIERLLEEHRKKTFEAGAHIREREEPQQNAKRSFSEYDTSDPVDSWDMASWLDVPGWELFTDTAFFGSWAGA